MKTSKFAAILAALIGAVILLNSCETQSDKISVGEYAVCYYETGQERYRDEYTESLSAIYTPDEFLKDMDDKCQSGIITNAISTYVVVE